MAKKQKHTIEIDFLDLKTRFKAGKMSIEEVDHATCKLIAELAVLTVNGVTEINGVSIDLYKDRVWWIVEKAGLLPEYRDEEDFVDEGLDEEDDYYNDDDFEYSIEIVSNFRWNIKFKQQKIKLGLPALQVCFLYSSYDLLPSNFKYERTSGFCSTLSTAKG
jgi:hypothetical protein